MPPTLPRTLAAITALTLVLGTTTACSDDASQAATTGAASASTSNASTPAPSSGTTSTTPSASQSAEPSKATSPASPAITTLDPQYVGTPAPGSTWTPPTLIPEQIQGNNDLRAGGFDVTYQDPAVIASIPDRTAIEPTFDQSYMAKDDIGAIKMTALYFDSLDYAVLSGDPEPLKSASQVDNSLTSIFVDQQKTWKENDAVIKSDEIYVENLTVTKRDGNEMHLVGDVHYPPTLAYFPSESLLIKSPDKSGRWEIELIWGEYGYWIVASANPIQQASQS